MRNIVKNDVASFRDLGLDGAPSRLPHSRTVRTPLLRALVIQPVALRRYFPRPIEKPDGGVVRPLCAVRFQMGVCPAGVYGSANFAEWVVASEGASAKALKPLLPDNSLQYLTR
jgi:hypothetical protein